MGGRGGGLSMHEANGCCGITKCLPIIPSGGGNNTCL